MAMISEDKIRELEENVIINICKIIKAEGIDANIELRDEIEQAIAALFYEFFYDSDDDFETFFGDEM